MVPVDLAYVIFIDFLALGVLGFCFLLLSNVQFLVLGSISPQDAVTQGGFLVDIVDDDILRRNTSMSPTAVDQSIAKMCLAWALI